MRTPEPQFLQDFWRHRQQAALPRCCHTCDHYLEDGRCDAYYMTPPDEFTQQRDVCPRWLEMIPF